MICPTCNQPAQRYQISRRMKEIAQRPRPLIRGTIRAQERARQAAPADALLRSSIPLRRDR